MELAEDYSRRIQRAREKKGWSREDLGRKINERVSIISKLEHGEMHPPDSLVKKLERALEIKLMELVEEVHTQGSAESRGMTLADFIIQKKR
jgi:putative transcription factor